MFTISKEYHFSASHILDGLPEGHPCGRLHGHNYIARFTLRDADLNAVGFVLDYREIDAIVKPVIDGEWDHRHLNGVVSFQPSAERLAEHLFERFKPAIPYLVAVSISETPKTWATYEGGR